MYKERTGEFEARPQTLTQNITSNGEPMEEFAIYATMKARAGQEKEVEALLESLLIYAEAERGTNTGSLCEAMIARTASLTRLTMRPRESPISRGGLRRRCYDTLRSCLRMIRKL